MVPSKWLKICLQLGLIAPIVRSVTAGNDLPGTEWEDVRREMLAFHGIRPDMDEKERFPITGVATQAIAPASSTSTEAIRNQEPAKRESRRLRHQVGRRIQDETTDCAGIYCFSASFRGRFGTSSFDTDQLKLPGKKGACFALETNIDATMELIKFLDPSWNYSWSCKVVEQQPAEIEFIPMIWTGWDPTRVKYLIDTYVTPAYEAGQVKRLLGFNEPDKKDQANLDVAKAIESWPTLEATGMPLVGPSVTTAGVGTWMKEWNEYAFKYQLRQDYISVHWYGEPSILAFQRYMKQMYELNGGETPLLITEMAPADWSAASPSENRFSRSQVLQFMKEILPWLEHPDQAHWIYGYAWFPFKASHGPGSCSSLFEEDGTPTPLGLYYRSVTPDNPYGDQTISY